jgi:hypothetical protein
LVRIPDRAQDAPLQIGAAAERVAELALQRVPGKRVDREIPPGEILVERDAEPDLRVPPVRGDVRAERRHLDRLARLQDSDRAVFDPDRVGPGEDLAYAFGESVGRDVPVSGRLAEQPVAHGPADGPGFVPRRPEPADNREQALRRGETRSLFHRWNVSGDC